MVEVNNDILDASRRVVFHGVAMGQTQAEAVPNFKGFLADMKEFLDFRASVIRGMGLTSTASFEDVQLPWYTPGTVDCADVPVIFWVTASQPAAGGGTKQQPKRARR